jgi:hypothetical protein
MIDDQSTWATPQTSLIAPQQLWEANEVLMGHPNLLCECLDRPLEHLKLLRQHSETSQKHALTYGVQNQRLERSVFVNGSPTRKSLIEEK